MENKKLYLGVSNFKITLRRDGYVEPFSLLNLNLFPWLLFYHSVFTYLPYLSFSWKTNMEMLSWEETMVSCLNSFSLLNMYFSIVRKILSSYIWWETATDKLKIEIKLNLSQCHITRYQTTRGGLEGGGWCARNKLWIL